MNRAPTCVRPAANGIQLGQHAVLPLPNPKFWSLIVVFTEAQCAFRRLKASYIYQKLWDIYHILTLKDEIRYLLTNFNR